jgi:hypothetical protein
LLHEVDQLNAKVSTKTTELKLLEAQITELINLDIEDIRGVAPRVSKLIVPGGSMIADVREFFRANANQPISSEQIQVFILTHCKLRLDEDISPHHLRKRVSFICFHLKHEGHLERLPSIPNKYGSREISVWRWIGPTFDEDVDEQDAHEASE